MRAATSRSMETIAVGRLGFGYRLSPVFHTPATDR
jgi:hypothetical protein